MLFFAAVLIVLVSLMHSVLGGRRLIDPITKMEELPVILGKPGMAALTLHVGWHILSFTWVCLAGLYVWMQMDPSVKSVPFLWVMTFMFGSSGVGSLILSKGRHLSWVLFLPIGALSGWAALG